MEAKDVRFIVIHCTAGFAPAKRVEEYFKRPKKKGGRGWKVGGYHVIINRDGEAKEMYPFNKLVNGVKGFNKNSLHIAYVGGVKIKDGVTISKDTRNPRQQEALIDVIEDAIEWLEENGKDVSKDLQVVGHRDFSHDGNKDNVIQSWERMKDCPCFDAIPEYEVYSSNDRCGLLPTN